MRKRLPFFASVALVSFLVPFATAQANITIFGVSIPCSNGWDCTLCAGASVIQNLINFMIIIAFPIAAVLFAYAGGLMMTSAANPSGIEKAKSIFKTVGIGFAFVLCCWIIVDTIIHTVIINNNATYFPNHTWNTVGQCVDRTNQTNKMVSALLGGLFAPNNPNQPPITGGGGGGGNGGGSHALCQDTNNNCSVSAIEQAGSAESANVSQNEAQALSCIAVTENGGAAVSKCDSSHTSCGTFQINNGNWTQYAPSNCKDFSMKNDASCNLQTAVNLFNAAGYQPWTGICTSAGGCGSTAYGQHWNSNAVECQTYYDPNTTRTKGY